MYYGNFAVHRLGACASLLGMSLREVHETLFLLRAAACSLVPHGFVLAGRVGLSGVAAATLDRAFGNIDGFEFDFARVGSKLRLALSGKWSTEAASAHFPPTSATCWPIPLHVPSDTCSPG